MVSDTAGQQAGGNLGGKGVDVVFAIDESGSMTVNKDQILSTIPRIVSDLQKKGAGNIRFGVVVFSDTDEIYVRLPLGAATPDAIKSLPPPSFSGGREPVGLATIVALGLFDKKPEILRQVVVLSDEDGLGDDKTYTIQFADAQKKAAALGIKVNLIKFK
jgi:hypothetical protein